MRESYPFIGRHDSLKLLSEKCSNAPTPTYDVHKPRKIRDHEPHIHFYKSISKTLDQKLRYVIVSYKTNTRSFNMESVSQILHEVFLMDRFKLSFSKQLEAVFGQL